jgi:hypothetical protein
VRNVCGGPPDGNYQPTLAASKIAFAPRGKVQLGAEIKRDLWEINFKKDRPASAQPPSGGGGGFAKPPTKSMYVFGALALLGMGGLAVGRRGR